MKPAALIALTEIRRHFEEASFAEKPYEMVFHTKAAAAAFAKALMSRGSAKGDDQIRLQGKASVRKTKPEFKHHSPKTFSVHYTGVGLMDAEGAAKLAKKMGGRKSSLDRSSPEYRDWSKLAPKEEDRHLEEEEATTYDVIVYDRHIGWEPEGEYKDKDKAMAHAKKAIKDYNTPEAAVWFGDKLIWTNRPKKGAESNFLDHKEIGAAFQQSESFEDLQLLSAFQALAMPSGAYGVTHQQAAKLIQKLTGKKPPKGSPPKPPQGVRALDFYLDWLHSKKMSEAKGAEQVAQAVSGALNLKRGQKGDKKKLAAEIAKRTNSKKIRTAAQKLAQEY